MQSSCESIWAEGNEKSALGVFPSPFVEYVDRGDAGWYPAWGPQPRTLAELRMRQFSWFLRSKPDWCSVLSRPVVLEQWRNTALEYHPALTADNRLSPNMINYVLGELAGYTKIRDDERGIECGCFDAIWRSDELLSDDFCGRLRAAVAVLEHEDLPRGMDGNIVNLIDPSLYSTVYGRTYASFPDPRSCGELSSPTPSEDQPEWTISTRFGWIPSDFSVNAEDGSVRLLSPYINNLHPDRHQLLYRAVEDALTAFVPMFERVLGDINQERRTPFPRNRIRTVDDNDGISCIWGEGEPALEEPDGGPLAAPAEHEFYEPLYETVPKILPEAHDRYAGELENDFTPVSLKGATIQCIIKLVNLQLTPEYPEHAGDDWHIDGMANENIVASIIYIGRGEQLIRSALPTR
ncbi:hypothetical protein DFH07DRAFT_576284 [Mycena maculata]|uniref:DUF4246 domain-containing protein n=1 Tax=Mycena maculata TaxID=230809 RepID=A0AAD7N6N4_9AGAR|nr:hypothetical protein DFH07DRAFT_576284 [Mycena maculata]